MIERGETDGSGIVNLGEGVSVLTHDFAQVKLPIDLPGGGKWVNVVERIYCEMKFGEDLHRCLLYVLSNPEYDVFVLLDGGGARWVAKVSEETLELLRGRPAE